MLTLKQMHILDQIYFPKQPQSTDELTAKEQLEIALISNHETLWQDVDRYLTDKFFAERTSIRI